MRGEGEIGKSRGCDFERRSQDFSRLAADRGGHVDVAWSFLIEEDQQLQVVFPDVLEVVRISPRDEIDVALRPELRGLFLGVMRE